MRVALDRSLCTGHAQCAALCPTVFDTDADGYAVLRAAGQVPAGAEEDAAVAIGACPERAISELKD